MDLSSIGFIGLGELGAALVRRLMQLGRGVVAWDVVDQRVDALVDEGAVRGHSAIDVAERCDLVIACVTDTGAVHEVVFGDAGIALAQSPPRVFVDATTGDPDLASEMAERLHAVTGTHWIDAPVTGGWTGALRGELVVFAGGDSDRIEALRPLFDDYAKRVVHTGPIGSGQTAKICNQVIIGATLAGVAEALNLAERYGMSPAAMPDILTGGWADSVLLQDHGRRMAAGDYSGSARGMLEDMDLCRSLGQRHRAMMPVTDLVASLYLRLLEHDQETTGQVGLMWLYRNRGE